MNKLSTIFLIFLVIGAAFFAGFSASRSFHRCNPLSGNFLLLEFKPGDRILATHYKQGGVMIENAPGTIIGLDYNPTWQPDDPLYYFVVFDGDEQKEGGRTASGIKPSELKRVK